MFYVGVRLTASVCDFDGQNDWYISQRLSDTIWGPQDCISAFFN